MNFLMKERKSIINLAGFYFMRPEFKVILISFAEKIRLLYIMHAHFKCIN